jgi:hypothetical protein
LADKIQLFVSFWAKHGCFGSEISQKIQHNTYLSFHLTDPQPKFGVMFAVAGVKNY